MHQHIHLLSNSNGGLPTDIWIPSIGNVKPMQADQISFGIAHTTPGNYEFSIDMYVKKMSNMIDYQEGLRCLHQNIRLLIINRQTNSIIQRWKSIAVKTAFNYPIITALI